VACISPVHIDHHALFSQLIPSHSNGRVGDSKFYDVVHDIATLGAVGGIVVDPFVGSGSTCIAALRQGRRVVGIEICAEWAELARERARANLSGSDYGARVSGQRALFG
jgi:16S rRNA G966 N2-methylase RsmD